MVRVRPVLPSDARGLQTSFALLSEASRFQRFHTGTPSLTNKVARFLASVDHTNHEALVAVAAGSAEIVGVARFIRGPQADEAELAITVADEWQRSGLGSALLRLLAERARTEGIRWFTMEMLADNEGILALVQGAGAVVQATGAEAVSGRIDLASRLFPQAGAQRAARAP